MADALIQNVDDSCCLPLRHMAGQRCCQRVYGTGTGASGRNIRWLADITCVQVEG